MNKLAGLFGPECGERELGLSFAIGEGHGVAERIPVCCVQAEVLTEGP